MQQSKRTHSVPRPMPPSTSSSSGRPPLSLAFGGGKPAVPALTSSTVSYPSDTSAFQQTSFSSSHGGGGAGGAGGGGRSNSRQGMATFSSRAEQQALFKLPPTQANNNQKWVVPPFLLCTKPCNKFCSLISLANMDKYVRFKWQTARLYLLVTGLSNSGWWNGSVVMRRLCSTRIYMVYLTVTSRQYAGLRDLPAHRHLLVFCAASTSLSPVICMY